MESVISKLDSINWDFDNRKKYSSEMIYPINCRKYYSYPATFIPEIPFTLVEILSHKGDLVLDPFGGIGTTFLQAVIQERRAISIDNNLIASGVNTDFFHLLNPFENIEKSMQDILQACLEYVPSEDYTINLNKLRRELDTWYHPDTFNEIAFLISIYDQMGNELGKSGKSLFHLCLSNILTTVSSQNGGWAYMADNVKPKENKIIYKQAMERFKFCMKQVVKDFEEYKRIGGKEFAKFYKDLSSARCIWNEDFSNFKNVIQEGTVDLIITSPPYPKMIDYIKSQRLSFYFEEKAFDEKLQQEIGARYYRNRKDSLQNYIISMKKCNEKLYSVLRSGGYLCYILPEFSAKEEKERSAAIDEVINDCKRLGLKVRNEICRCIPGTQRANNIKWASLKKEKILVMEKK